MEIGGGEAEASEGEGRLIDQVNPDVTYEWYGKVDWRDVFLFAFMISFEGDCGSVRFCILCFRIQLGDYLF